MLNLRKSNAAMRGRFTVCQYERGSSMLIHDFSDNSIRKAKIDRADSLKIANYALTFWQELREYSVEDENRQLLKIQSRLYERTLNSSVALRNGLISLLDQVFPGANKLFGMETRTALGHIKWVDFIRRFWHKDTQAVDSLNAVYDTLQILRGEMYRPASLLPEFEIVMSIQGAGKITGPQFMAEIGDVRRFTSKGALVAFAGVDAPPYQSGTFGSKSRHVSKRGSPHLHRALFTICSVILQHADCWHKYLCTEVDQQRC